MSFSLRSCGLLLVLVATGCSAAEPPSIRRPTTGTDNDPSRLSDGEALSGAVEIAAGSVVTIDPGAVVTMNEGSALVVKGTLKAATADARARLIGLNWKGITVVKGGKVELDGVEIVGAETAIDLQSDSEAVFDHVSIKGDRVRPFVVAKGATLTMKNSEVIQAKDTSIVKGKFIASYIDYEITTKDGISAQDPSAEIKIEDSELHGDFTQDTDMINSAAAAKITVAYSIMHRVHCNLHFDNVTAFDVSYSDLHNATAGAMLYGSETQGEKVIRSSNIFENGAGLDEEGASSNGPIKLTDLFFEKNGDDGNQSLKGPKTLRLDSPRTSRVANTGPRRR